VLEHVHAGLATAVAGPLVQTLRAWRGAGETAVFAALPRPGHLAGMPRAALDVLAAASAAGECVIAPSVGGLLVPTCSAFGTDGDRGVLAQWAAYDGLALPRHVSEATDLGELSRRLAEAMQEATSTLRSVGGLPWRGDEAHPQPTRGHQTPMPRGIAPKALNLMQRSDRIRALALDGLSMEADGPALDATTSAARAAALRGVVTAADAALAGATNVAVMALAGWRPA
ncbi:MAG: hypothetical protein WAR57_12235, partial [Candidatus Phosphoribacter sp.]